MKHIILAACLVLPMPAMSQESSEIDEGFSLMEEGAKLLFRGLLGEVEPRLEDLGDMASELEPALEMLASEMGPALLELLQALDSVLYYEKPEILPNGDIIIRRSPDAPVYGGPADAPDEGVIDL